MTFIIPKSTLSFSLHSHSLGPYPFIFLLLGVLNVRTAPSPSWPMGRLPSAPWLPMVVRGLLLDLPYGSLEINSPHSVFLFNAHQQRGTAWSLGTTLFDSLRAQRPLGHSHTAAPPLISGESGLRSNWRLSTFVLLTEHSKYSVSVGNYCSLITILLLTSCNVDAAEGFPRDPSQNYSLKNIQLNYLALAGLAQWLRCPAVWPKSLRFHSTVNGQQLTVNRQWHALS